MAGSLDHAEVANLVSQIPQLTLDEQKFIISYLYQSDVNADGSLTFDEVMVCVASFGKRQPAGGALPAAAGAAIPYLGHPAAKQC